MSIKDTVEKIYKKVYDDHHITPEEFQMSFERRKETYEELCADMTDEDKEKIKRACELLDLIFTSKHREEISAAVAELEIEFEVIEKEEWKLGNKLRAAIEFHRATALVKKFKDRDAYTTKAIRNSYRKPMNEYKNRRY